MEDNEAESMVKHVEDVLFNDPKPKCRPLFPSQHLTNRVVKLEEGMKYFYHQDGSNPSDENSALVHYIQVLVQIRRWLFRETILLWWLTKTLVATNRFIEMTLP